MRALTLGAALVLSLCSAEALAQVCGNTAEFDVLSCSSGTFWCPSNSYCGSNKTCFCNTGYTAVDCEGTSCADTSCIAPNWHCVQIGGCGSSAAFDVVDCGDGTWCPLYSTCGTSSCTCKSGYTSRNCSGTACNGTCTAPNYYCASGTGGGTGGTGGSGGGTGGFSGGGGTGGFGGGGGSGGSGGGGGFIGDGGTRCSGTQATTVDSCGADICACSASCTTNSQCNSGCCSAGYCSLPCVCNGLERVVTNCAAGSTFQQALDAGPKLKWGCAVGGPAMFPLLVLLALRRRRSPRA